MKNHCCLFIRLLGIFSLFLIFGMPLTYAQEDGDSAISVENGGQLIESAGNMPDWPEEGWDGANDGKVLSWDDTVTVFNTPEEGGLHPWAIFAFADEAVQPINSVAFFVLTMEVISDNRYQTRAGKEFQILVSTTGIKEDDFDLVLEGTLEIDLKVPFEDEEWIQFDFDPVKAKYVKLVFLSNYGDGTYTTLGEFAVYASDNMAVQPSGKTSVTWGEIKDKQ